MKILLAVLVGLAAMLIQPGAARAYTINGSYFTLVSCNYQYNPDFRTAGYVGVYRGPSGAIYTGFFPTSNYSWCPY